MRHHSGLSVPGSDHARRPGGVSNFPGSVFLKMAAGVTLSAAAAALALKVAELQTALLGPNGFTTGRDLSGLGRFSTIVLVSLVVAMLVNLFLSLLRFTGRRR